MESRKDKKKHQDESVLFLLSDDLTSFLGRHGRTVIVAGLDVIGIDVTSRLLSMIFSLFSMVGKRDCCCCSLRPSSSFNAVSVFGIG